MPCHLSLLERGAVCLALYPYTTGFPLHRVLRDVEEELDAQLERHDSVESVAATIKVGEPPPDVVVTMKLRRILLLQTGTSPGRQDIVVARINSITEKKRSRDNWYRKLQNRIHPAHFLIGDQQHHGTGGEEAYIDLLSITTIRKASILRRVGGLEAEEMREVSDRVLRTLELDISEYVERLIGQ